MGFDPDQVGLSGERISGVFGESRPKGCPHKGLDITSSRMPKPFTAGVFGRVIAPIGGPWGTITISPFNQPSTLIQYLHCSAINVKIGDVVAPWTNMGLTGDTAPAGSGITGIHLHIQVVQPGTSTIPCWKGTNYVNPATWPTIDLLAGDWMWTWTAQVFGPVVQKSTRVMQITGSSLNAAVSINGDDDLENTYNGIAWTCSGGWFNGTIASRTQTHIQIPYLSGSCSCTGGGSCEVVPASVDCFLVDMNSISITSGGAPFIATRASGLTMRGQGVELDDASEPPSRPPCVIAISAEAHRYLLASSRTFETLEEHFGVLRDEVF